MPSLRRPRERGRWRCSSILPPTRASPRRRGAGGATPSRARTEVVARQILRREAAEGVERREIADGGGGSSRARACRSRSRCAGGARRRAAGLSGAGPSAACPEAGLQIHAARQTPPPPAQEEMRTGIRKVVLGLGISLDGYIAR